MIAQRGAGKSTLGRWLTRDAHRLIVVDTFHEHVDGIILFNVHDLLPLIKKKQFRLIWRPLTVGPEIKWIFFAALAARNLTIFIDEVSQWTKPQSLAPGMEQIIRMGRHRDVKMVATTHRPADVHKLLISQSDLVLGRMFETNDLNYIRPFFPLAAKILPTIPEPKIANGKITLAFVRPLQNTKVQQVTIAFNAIGSNPGSLKG